MLLRPFTGQLSLMTINSINVYHERCGQLMFKIKVSLAQEMFNHHYLVPNGIGDNKSTDLIWLDKSRPHHPCMATIPYSLAGEGGECTHVTETVTIKPRVLKGLTFESVDTLQALECELAQRVHLRHLVDKAESLSCRRTKYPGTLRIFGGDPKKDILTRDAPAEFLLELTDEE